MPREQNRHQIKTGFFNFSQIEKYFLHSEPDKDSQRIQDRTFADLDLEDVFSFIDRTASSIGQQYLYSLIRTIPGNRKRVESLENKISVFKKNPAFRSSASKEIARLEKSDAYYISALFQGRHITPPRWFWAVQTLSVISLISVILSFFISKALLVLFLIFPVNMALHYWNKNNLYQYSSSILQLLILRQIAAKLVSNPELAHATNVMKSVEALGFPAPAMSVFKLEAKLQSEIGQLVDYLLELIKALFLVEPVILFSVLKKLEANREDISIIYHFVAETDVALSTLALRESVPFFSTMDVVENDVLFNAKEIYHPLLINGVSNDITLNGRSALLTGSNMSGKTTFIRTVGINAILGQTINTCFARAFKMPLTQIHSAIRISDDLLDGKSYYLEEVATIKTIVEESAGPVKSLVLLDELFKGTNSIERIAIAKSVLGYLARDSNLVFVATHDRELATYLAETYETFHFTEIIDEDQIHFDYKIKHGPLLTTNAIKILALNQFPAEIISDALGLSAHLSQS